jgi:hypothetical protein
MSALCQEATYAVQQVRRLFGSCLAIAASRQPQREHRALARFACHRHITAHHARELAPESKAELVPP